MWGGHGWLRRSWGNYGGRILRSVDPNHGLRAFGSGDALDEAIRIEFKGAGESDGPLVENGAMNAEVDLGRREVPEC